MNLKFFSSDIFLELHLLDMGVLFLAFLLPALFILWVGEGINVLALITSSLYFLLHGLPHGVGVISKPPAAHGAGRSFV